MVVQGLRKEQGFTKGLEKTGSIFEVDFRSGIQFGRKQRNTFIFFFFKLAMKKKNLKNMSIVPDFIFFLFLYEEDILKKIRKHHCNINSDYQLKLNAMFK